MLRLTAINDLGRGLRSYLRGLGWLRAHPRYLLLLFVPMLVGLGLVAGGLFAFAHYHDNLLAAILFDEAPGWAGAAVYFICKVFAIIAIFVTLALASLLLMNVVAAPLFDVVSAAIEQDLTGVAPPNLTLGQQLLVMLVELKKAALIFLVSILVLFIPGLNVVSTLIAAFLIGWDFFDYPLARRDWSLRQRLHLVLTEGFAVLGLGLWLVIPFLQIIMLPLAVAGGTILSIEALQNSRLSPLAETRT